MEDNHEINLKKYCSSYVVIKPPKELHSDATCKSELNVTPKAFSVASSNCDKHVPQNIFFKEYYKRYEHDEIPVKDSKENNVSVAGSLTNSDLDRMEIKIFKNVSQQLQTDDGTIPSLETNIKLFQTTVEEIFDNFYTYMKDFDIYKKRYQEILSKTLDDSVTYMEDFIKDMIQHIISTETISNQSREKTVLSMQAFTEKDINVSEVSEGLYTASKLTTGTSGILEAYKNDSYLTDSTFDDKSCTRRHYAISDKTFLLTSAPCAKMTGRNLLSEINLKDQNTQDHTGNVVSADNMTNLVAKRKEMEKQTLQHREDMHDIEIPVKVSSAKKNIYLNEDFTGASTDNKPSFISKICNFLCKTFRKNSFGRS